MKKDQVHIGGAFVAKVSGKLATVRIDAESRFGGWEATNVDTGRKVRIKSAQRLRHEVTSETTPRAAPAKAKAPHPERDWTTLAEFFPALRERRPASAAAPAAADRPPPVCVQRTGRQDIDERLAAAPPSIVPYEERRARAEAAQSESAGDAGRRYDPPLTRRLVATETTDREAIPELRSDRRVKGPSRCATPRCRGTPVMTYLERPLCQACWDRHCEEEQSSEVNESAGDACLPAQAGRPAEAPPTPEEENAMSKKKSTKKQFTRKPTKAPPATAKARGGKKAAVPKAKATTETKPKRVSALDAAAQVLAKTGKPMRAQELIAAMVKQGLWSSPGGKTPHATLYAAMIREQREKGGASRFRKVDRGQFTFNTEDSR